MPAPRKSPAPSTFPKTIRSGSAAVQIYLTPTKVKGEKYTQYTLVYYSGGKRIRRKFSDFKAATQQAELAAAKIASGELAVLTLTSEDTAAYFKALELIQDSKKNLVVVASEYMEAVRLLPASTTLIEACRDYSNRNSEVKCDLQIPKLAEMYIEYLKKGGRSKRHIQTQKSRTTRFAKAFNCFPKSIQRESIELFLDNLSVGAKTRKKEIESISQFTNWMIRLKYAPKDIAEEVKALQKPVTKDSPIIIWSVDELTELLENSPKNCIPYLVLGAFCGLRSSEILRANWSHITSCGGHFQVIGEKGNKSRRTVPISEAAIAWLASHKKASGPISPHPRSSKVHKLIRDSINQVRLKANQKAFTWKNNALRHSYGSYRVAVIKNIPQVAFEMGNTPRTIQTHYLHVVTPEEGQRFFSILPKKLNT
jgi:integrase